MKTNQTWGGSWTEQKLDAFEKYVNAYLTIMNKHRFGRKLIYFDAFAGSGTREYEEKETHYFNFMEEMGITEEEIKVYKSAAERVVSLKQSGFDYYYFIESNDVSKNELEAKLNSINHDNKLKLIFRVTDANKQINIMADAMKKDRKYFALTLLDPFGMQVNWSSIEKLEGTNTDLWILIPSGVIINRLLDRDGKLTHIDKLVSFFGLPEEEIRKCFYKETEIEHGLFENVSFVQKIEEPIKCIINLYIQRLNKLFKYVTETPLEMRNSRNCPIYHFAFASNNATARKIANDIIGRI